MGKKDGVNHQASRLSFALDPKSGKKISGDNLKKISACSVYAVCKVDEIGKT
jgi:hypothetical protein